VQPRRRSHEIARIKRFGAIDSTSLISALSILAAHGLAADARLVYSVSSPVERLSRAVARHLSNLSKSRDNDPWLPTRPIAGRHWQTAI
jgi:hypothetical protein